MKQMCISSPLFLFVSVLSRKKYPLITSPQRSKYKSNEYILFSIFGLECLLALLLLSRIRTDPYHRLPGFSLSPPQTHKDTQQTRNQDRLLTSNATDIQIRSRTCLLAGKEMMCSQPNPYPQHTRSDRKRKSKSQSIVLYQGTYL